MDIATDPMEEMDPGTLAALYEETFRNFEEGTITEGRVVAIQKDKVIVDIDINRKGSFPMSNLCLMN